MIHVVAERGLKARLAKIEKFSEDGLPFLGFNMNSTKELFENYLEMPKPLLDTELVHLKLIAMSLNCRTSKQTNLIPNATDTKTSEINNYILRLLLSMNYVPSLTELQAQKKAVSKQS